MVLQNMYFSSLKLAILPLLISYSLLVGAVATAQSVDNGRTLYSSPLGQAASCSRCHRANLEGSGSRPSLLAYGRSSRANWSHFSGLVKNGRGAMPSFERHYTDEQICSLFLFIRAEAGQPALLSDCNLSQSTTPPERPTEEPEERPAEPSEPPPDIVGGRDWARDYTLPRRTQVESFSRIPGGDVNRPEVYLHCKGGDTASVKFESRRAVRYEGSHRRYSYPRYATLAFRKGTGNAPTPGTCVAVNQTINGGQSFQLSISLRHHRPEGQRPYFPGRVNFSYSNGGEIAAPAISARQEDAYWDGVFKAINNEGDIFVKGKLLHVVPTGVIGMNVHDIDLE